jgi:hypothetical protein
LPKEFEAIVQLDGKKPVSLYHALTAFVGSPSPAAKYSSNFLELILLAASWIALPEVSMGLVPSISLTPNPVPELQKIQIQRVMDAGWNLAA